MIQPWLARIPLNLCGIHLHRFARLIWIGSTSRHQYLADSRDIIKYWIKLAIHPNQSACILIIFYRSPLCACSFIFWGPAQATTSDILGFQTFFCICICYLSPKSTVCTESANATYKNHNNHQAGTCHCHISHPSLYHVMAMASQSNLNRLKIF